MKSFFYIKQRVCDSQPIQGPEKEQRTRMLQNHMKYSVYNSSNLKLYFNLLIQISSNYFLHTSLDFPKRLVIFGFYPKMCL